jgi:hypothetical protein
VRTLGQSPPKNHRHQHAQRVTDSASTVKGPLRLANSEAASFQQEHPRPRRSTLRVTPFTACGDLKQCETGSVWGRMIARRHCAATEVKATVFSGAWHNGIEEASATFWSQPRPEQIESNFKCLGINCCVVYNTCLPQFELNDSTSQTKGMPSQLRTCGWPAGSFAREMRMRPARHQRRGERPSILTR